MQSIGHIIRSSRTRRGLTLRELGARVPCTPGYLSQIENGRCARPPSEAMLHRLAAALDVEPGRLVELAAVERLPESLRAQLALLNDLRPLALALARLVLEQCGCNEGRLGEVLTVAIGSDLVLVSPGVPDPAAGALAVVTFQDARPAMLACVFPDPEPGPVRLEPPAAAPGPPMVVNRAEIAGTYRPIALIRALHAGQGPGDGASGGPGAA
jgi:transcriptional regulator with XRE-family HTH domain